MRAVIEYYNSATLNGKTNRAIRASLNVFEWRLRGQRRPFRGLFVPRPAIGGVDADFAGN